MKLRNVLSTAITLCLVGIPVAALAQGDIELTVTPTVDCDLVTFEVDASGGTTPFELSWEFGDGDSLVEPDVAGFPFQTEHLYPAQGDYDWMLAVVDFDGASATTEGSLMLEGPSVELTSVPFPPLLYLQDGEATVDFTATATGGNGPYTFIWDSDSDGSPELEEDVGQASFTYAEAGGYLVTVLVVDQCGFSAETSLRVVVIDLDAEACHPMAQRIADAVNSLFPSQADQLYTCSDIYEFFDGGLIGSQLGFGRMWHAYHLSQTIPDLSWEEIRDWHLAGNGWGGLVQLDRIAGELDEFGVRELFDLVLSGEVSIGDLRHSMHAVVRYGADFEDALMRMSDGASPGELGRFYRTAQDLNLEPTALDQYLAEGLSLQELSHAARVAARNGSEWEQVAEAHAAGHSWGAIQQAQRLAGDGDWTQVLEDGVRETRQELRDQSQQEREQERDQHTAAQLARQYEVSESEVWALFNGACQGDWKCVRTELREASGRGGGPKKDD